MPLLHLARITPKMTTMTDYFKENHNVQNDMETITMTDLIKKENQMTFEEKYEELCDLIKGDSPNWTHEEIKARLEEQVDALIEKENG